MLKKSPLLSIIVPAYNEELLLPEFLREVCLCMEKSALGHEIIIIENGSEDRTLEIAKNFSTKNSNIVVEHLNKPGYGQALIRGIKLAKGKYILIYNVDFWDKKFIDLVKVDLLGYDIVVGSKSLPGSSDKRSFLRRFITKITNFLLKLLLGFSGTDTHGIKVFSTDKIIPVLRKCKTRTGIFDSELLIRAERMGLKILELPVSLVEKRPNRFGIKRIIETPKDFWQLYQVLQ